MQQLLSVTMALVLAAAWWAVAPAESEPPCEVDVIVHGTVRLVKIQNGCWTFDADDGRNYELLTGNRNILRDGLEGTLWGDVDDLLGTTCHVGLPTSVCKFEADRSEVAQGTLRFECIEGGCWIFTVGETSFQPLSQEVDFYRHDATIKARFVRRRDLLSFCQVGPIIEILEFAIVEDGTDPPDCLDPIPVELDLL